MEGSVQSKTASIWKVTEPVAKSEIKIDIPRGSTLLHVGDQSNSGTQLDFWFFVPDVQEQETEPRTFHVLGTGHTVDPQKWCAADYWRTVVTAGGALVWHVFKEGKG